MNAHPHASGLLTLIAAVCVVGVASAAIRAVFMVNRRPPFRGYVPASIRPAGDERPTLVMHAEATQLALADVPHPLDTAGDTMQLRVYKPAAHGVCRTPEFEPAPIEITYVTCSPPPPVPITVPAPSSPSPAPMPERDSTVPGDDTPLYTATRAAWIGASL